MKGDPNKPINSFYRWIDAFADGSISRKIGNHGRTKRIPSQLLGRRAHNKWLLRYYKRLDAQV